jgi:hypothetical protein
MRLALFCLLSLAALPAQAIGILGYDHARPLDPGRLEIGGGTAFGDSLINVHGLARFGVLPDLEAGVRGGLAVLADADDSGFEVEGVAKFRFLRQADTNDIVTLSVVGSASLLNTADRFLLGVDPSVLASHHFPLTADREIYIAAGLGLAVSFIDNEDSKTEFGLLGSFAAGVDIVEMVRLGIEARLRDDLRRLGLGVTFLF